MNSAHSTTNRPASDSPATSGASAVSFHTFLIAFRCWWHVAVPLALLLALCAAVGTYYLSTPEYTASTWLLIRERPFVLVQATAAEDSKKFVENQIELLRSSPVLEPVASDPAVATTPELAHELDPVAFLRTNLRVRAIGKSDFFEVSFTSQSPEKAAIIVNKVAKEYYDLQGRHEAKTSSRTIELLQEQQIARQLTVRQLRATLQELSKQIFGKDAFAAQRPDDRGPTPNPFADLEQRLITAQVERETLAARITAEKELLAKESFEPSPADVLAQIESLPQLQELRRRMDATRAKLAEHKSISTDLNRNTLYQQVNKQLKDDEAKLEGTLVALRTATKEDLERFARAKRENAIAELETQLRALDVSVRVWSERVKDKRGVQSEVAADSLQFELVKADYERASQLLDAISTRILTMQTEQRAPERVEIFRTANIPTRPDQSIAYKKMGMAVMVGLSVPFMLAIGVEILYRRVSSRQQLEQTGLIPIVAEVTVLPRHQKSRTGNDLLNRGRQLYEESIDGLRTYLSLMESMRGRKILAVTSAISREGKTSIAAQLAVSVASATNRPTLLIDADMRSPDLNRIFGVECSPGLCELLKGECPIEEAIDTSFSETLHLITAGDLDSSPHRLVGNNALANLIENLKTKYEYIVIDTPPILAASEALLIANVADAAIVCARRDFSRIDQVIEAFSRLQSAGVNTVGAVLNGVPQYAYAYRYGSYYYQKRRPSYLDSPEPAMDSSLPS